MTYAGSRVGDLINVYEREKGLVLGNPRGEMTINPCPGVVFEVENRATLFIVDTLRDEV